MILDFACPTTEVGMKWIRDFFSCLCYDQKQNVEMYDTRFGGGEVRHSKYSEKFPCVNSGRLLKLRTEIILEDLPLLGNCSLKLACAVIDVVLRKFAIFGNEMELSEESSVHFSIKISPLSQDSPETAVTLVTTTDEYTEKEIWRLHHYFGHASVEKLSRLLKNAGKLSTEAKSFLEKIRGCESCRFNANKKPKPKIALPRVTECNELVSLDLKVYDSEGKYACIPYAVDLCFRGSPWLYSSTRKMR